MYALFVSLGAFIGLQMVPAMPNLKASAVKALGKSYGPLFGVAMLLATGLVLWSFRNAPRSQVYDPPGWGIHANYGLSLIAFICFGIFAFRGRLRNALRYPLLLAVIFWAAGHLLANGDSATITFVLGLTLSAWLVTYAKLRNGTSVPSEVRRGHDLLGPLFGVAAYAVMVQLHHAIIGVPVFELIK
jgi:uncharacterized membrane protein